MSSSADWTWPKNGTFLNVLNGLNENQSEFLDSIVFSFRQPFASTTAQFILKKLLFITLHLKWQAAFIGRCNRTVGLGAAIQGANCSRKVQIQATGSFEVNYLARAHIDMLTAGAEDHTNDLLIGRRPSTFRATVDANTNISTLFM